MCLAHLRVVLVRHSNKGGGLKGGFLFFGEGPKTVWRWALKVLCREPTFGFDELSRLTSDAVQSHLAYTLHGAVTHVLLSAARLVRAVLCGFVGGRPSLLVSHLTPSG